MNDRRDRFVLITGTSRGIGRATALRLASSGLSVIAGVRNPAGRKAELAPLGDVADTKDAAARAEVIVIAVPWTVIGDVTAELLYQNGFKSAEDLAQSDEETLGDIDGIGPERAAPILLAAREHVVAKQRDAAAEVERVASEAAAAERAAAMAVEEALATGEQAVPAAEAAPEEGSE